jgi:hypothetical protein
MGKKRRGIIMAIIAIAVVAIIIVAAMAMTGGSNGGRNPSGSGTWKVGDYTVSNWTMNHYNGQGVLQYTETANLTRTVTVVNGTNVTMTVTFDNGIRANTTTTVDTSINYASMLNNITLVGKETVQTAYGNKLLSHYSRSEPGPSYDIYIDVPSGITFKQVTSTGLDIITVKLISTNAPWIQEMDKQ